MKGDDAAIYQMRAQAYVGLGAPQRALDDLNQTLRLQPDWADALADRAAVKCLLFDFRGAVQDCNRALKIDPLHVNAFYQRGCAKHKNGNNKSACTDWYQAQQLKDERADQALTQYCD